MKYQVRLGRRRATAIGQVQVLLTDSFWALARSVGLAIDLRACERHDGRLFEEIDYELTRPRATERCNSRLP